MEPRARRLVIREHLNQARAALDAGDRAGALDAVNAALAVDPEYLAAQALRDQIERSTQAVWSAGLKPEPHKVKPDAPTVSPDRQPVLPVEPPIVSAEGWARFEHRAKTRRLERRVAAARLAIQKRRFSEARAILQEIGEIDSGHPDLISLGIELDAEQHIATAPQRPWGPAIAALLIAAAVIFGARYLQSPEWTSNVPVTQSTGALPADASAGVAAPAVTTPAAALPIATTSTGGDKGIEPIRALAPALEGSSTQAVPTPPPSPEPGRTIEPVERKAGDPAPQARDAVPTPTRGSIVWPPVTIQQATSVPAPQPASEQAFTPPQPSLAPAVTAAALPGTVSPERADTIALSIVPRDPDTDRAHAAAVAVMNTARDEDLVRRTLQQYRAAYESLDARSAHAVWPTVSEAALMRAFSGLESQQLNFDDCDVQVRGMTGLATCRGTMLYVPKVGSHDVRREPRVWTFDLRKVGDNWQINNARTAR